MDFFKPIFLTMKMAFNLNKFYYGVCGNIHENTTKDNVIVTSLNISEIDGTIGILNIFKSFAIF